MINLKKNENGTAADVISSHVSTARVMIPDNNCTSAERWLNLEFSQIPYMPKPEKEENDPIVLLNKAYEALPPEDRDEMEIWDCTIKDGLEDE